MTKKAKTVQSPRKGKKTGKPITTTSIAFKTKILNGLKSHDLHKNDDLSISWIVNELCKKFLAGEVVLK